MNQPLLKKYITALAEHANRGHYCCDGDTWYSCPAHPEGCADDRQPAGVCRCGADEHNAAVNNLVKLIEAELS